METVTKQTHRVEFYVERIPAEEYAAFIDVVDAPSGYHFTGGGNTDYELVMFAFDRKVIEFTADDVQKIENHLKTTNYNYKMKTYCGAERPTGYEFRTVFN